MLDVFQRERLCKEKHCNCLFTALLQRIAYFEFEVSVAFMLKD